MATAIGQERLFRIGRVFQTSLSVIGGNLALAIGLTVVSVGLSAYLAPAPQILVERMFKGDLQAAAPYILDVLMQFVVRGFFASALTQATVDDLSGRPSNLGLCLSVGARMVLPVTAISVIRLVTATLGMFLLVVPGLIVTMMWAVAAPAQVVERRGVIASFERSRSLTKGHRWAIASLLLITIVIGLPISLLKDALGSSIGSYASMMIEGLMTSLLTAFTAVLMTVAYLELRLIKEGADLVSLTDVFT